MTRTDRSPTGGERRLGQGSPLAHRSIAGISTRGWTTLIAVLAVVVLITLSSLRGFAVRENERHAASLLASLGALLSGEVQAAETHDLRALAEGGGPVDLEDARWVGEDGETLARHGYHLRWLQGPGGAPVLVAWPERQGRTGTRVFGWTPEAGLVERPNTQAAWSGLERPPTAEWLLSAE